MSEDFLSRWSRRKDAARRADRSTARSDEAATITPAARQPQADDPETTRGAEPALTPEEIAALPKIDELTPDSDIKGFLRRGVPEGLRKAALRKMWTLDPAIRDFVGHARDYDYDWNTPGGAPGHRPLAPGDDVAAMVRRILGRSNDAESSRTADAKPVDSSERETPASPEGSETAADPDDRKD